jgi:hypothetical protein
MININKCFVFHVLFFYSMALLMYDGFVNSIRGSMTQDFQPQVFSWISFPRAPEYPIQAISNFVTRICGNIRNFVFMTPDKLLPVSLLTGDKLFP